jgi:hypothetical protein
VALDELKRHDEARVVLERAWELRRAESTPPELRGSTAFSYARQLWVQGEREQARQLAALAEQAYRAAEGEHWAPQIANIVRWRAAH